ncbi:hypothetical protein HIM_12157 [Hirsutella minnesotensis 3608]|uniref:Berberine/berberine-like domain-containing protein n=1 Tax=Hirsutella minnesotensis 3608 TaxID=1043627 RepID=A0A0F7ZIC6_9HYPO|nr:hypothetical protein HIM_12157 [Hirsutella minnesotensis 3608]
MRHLRQDFSNQITFATTFTNSIQQLHDVWAEFERTTLKLGQASGTSLAVTFFPIVPSLIAASKARGGNVMGLEAPPEGLVMTVGSLSFTAAEYGVMSGLADGLLSGIIEAAKRNHVHHPYIDLNHAKGSQKPFLGYGAGNYAFLKSTSQKYDPRGVFQALMPGGFKL